MHMFFDKKVKRAIFVLRLQILFNGLSCTAQKVYKSNGSFAAQAWLRCTSISFKGSLSGVHLNEMKVVLFGML